MLSILFVFHSIDGLRSLCAIIHIMSIGKKAERMGSRLDLSEFLLNEEDAFAILTKSTTCFEKFYYSLAINDLLFLVGFILLHLWRISFAGDSCSQSIL
jgi:hypothetical protein